MNELEWEDPWAPAWKKRWMQKIVGVSQTWVLVALLCGTGLLIWLGVTWTLNSWHLQEQEDHLASLGEDVDWLRQREEWAQGFVRTRLAVLEVAKRKMTARQVGVLTETLWQQSRTYGFDPLLIVAVMQVESSSNPWARGKFRSGAESGALGLMQLKLGTAQLMGRALGISIQSEADLMKPEVNLLLGTYYLLRLIVRYGNVTKGLMAYNIGPYALEKKVRNGGRLPVGYSRKILVEYRNLVQKFGQLQ
ncbi:MAG TPA: transglycosylase SLT domain-containing protein [Fibrobacteraceae bacterium]|nr:transglycosylase SLT domain-containing protein [Fibrobacteraceae bacterium]